MEFLNRFNATSYSSFAFRYSEEEYIGMFFGFA